MSHYTQFFNFQARPFDSRATRSPVLATESLKNTFQEIQSALAKDVPVILLQGPSGVGKSSLARVIPKLLARERWTFTLQSPSSNELEDAIQAFESSSQAEASVPSVPLCILDEAEAVSNGCLETLASILRDWNGSPGLSCILIRSVDPKDRDLSTGIPPLLEEFVSQEVQFEPLSISGTQRYIEKHIQRVGGTSEELFPEEVMRAIHRRAEGLPREISRLCEEMLTRAARKQTKSLDPEWLEDSTTIVSSGEEVNDEAYLLLSESSALAIGHEEPAPGRSEDADPVLHNTASETAPPLHPESSSFSQPAPQKKEGLAFRIGFSALVLLVAAASGLWLYNTLGQSQDAPVPSQKENSTPASFASQDHQALANGITPKQAPLQKGRSLPVRPLALRQQGTAKGLRPLAVPPAKNAGLPSPLHAHAPALWLDNQNLLNQIRASAEKNPKRTPERFHKQAQRQEEDSVLVQSDGRVSADPRNPL